MWYAADLGERVKHAGAYNYQNVTPQFDWKSFKPRRDEYVKNLTGVYARNFDREGVEYHSGWGRFKDATTIEVTANDGSTYDLHADYITIATGSKATVPSDDKIPGASLGITSDGFFDLEDRPKSIAIVGAGYIALELAGILNALGTETHMFLRHERVLRTFDPMIQDVITDWTEHTGVKIHKSTQIVKVEGTRVGEPVTVHTDKGESYTVDYLLWAIGREPYTEDMGLEKIGVKLDEHGAVIVDEYQTTSVPNIFAIGDVAGKALLTPVAIAAGRRLSNRIFGGPKYKNDKISYENIPTVVFACVVLFTHIPICWALMVNLGFVQAPYNWNGRVNGT